MLAPSRLHAAGTSLNPVQAMSGVLGLAKDRTGRSVDDASDEQPDNPRRTRPRAPHLLRIDTLPNTSARIREEQTELQRGLATSSIYATPPVVSQVVQVRKSRSHTAPVADARAPGQFAKGKLASRISSLTRECGDESSCRQSTLGLGSQGHEAGTMRSLLSRQGTRR
jgi:hypothetical protein